MNVKQRIKNGTFMQRNQKQQLMQKYSNTLAIKRLNNCVYLQNRERRHLLCEV